MSVLGWIMVGAAAIGVLLIVLAVIGFPEDGSF
ncbi:MAG: hypothetical protein ACI841_002231 [Planctomycetota bacterium]|jgi:hypothetical protein